MEYTYDNFIIPEALNRLVDAYNSQGFKIYLVGGAVRDIILGDTPADYDLVTDATPEQTINILQSLNCKIHRQGERFGVIGSSIDKIKIEITTFRKDLYTTHERLSEVEFNVPIEEDALRRDIPYNAMYYDIRGKKLFDYVNGIDDMKNKITRLIRDPVLRISEDKLRVLRVLRYACKYKHVIEENTINAIKNSDLNGISKERIYSEITLAFNNGNFDVYLNYLEEFNLFQHVFPDLNVDYDRFIGSKHLIIYLAYILRNNDDIEPKLEALKYDRRTINVIKFLLELVVFDPLKIVKYLKNKRQLDLDNETILNEWINTMNLGEQQQKFTTYKSIITQEVVNKLMREGLSGKELAKKINEIEYNQFVRD